MMHMKIEECLAFVSEILNVLKSTNQHEKVLHLIVDRIVRMYRCQTCAVIVIDPKTEYLSVANSFGLSHTFSKAFRRKLATGAVGRLIWTGTPILIPDSSSVVALAEEVRLEQPFGSCLCVQMSADHRTLGYLHADSAETSAFSAEDVRVLQAFADFAALALQRSRLIEENLRLDPMDHETETEKYAPFLERLDSSVERAQSMKEPLALLLLDVDNFKQIALTYGYEASRQMLKEIAALIKSEVRPTDGLGRYGFDEFILVRDHSSVSDALAFADRLREKVAGRTYTSRGIRTTVSIGVTVYPDDADSVQTLLLRAKSALYEAQRSGRNTIFHGTKSGTPGEA